MRHNWLRATRITSLILWAVPVLIYLAMTIHRGIVYHFGYIRPMTALEVMREIAEGLMPGLYIGGPLLVAAGIAWKWPRLGGMLLLVLSVPFIYGPLASYDAADWAASIGVVYALLGLAYLVSGWPVRREKRASAG